MRTLIEAALSAAGTAVVSAEPPYLKTARDIVTVYCREVLQREPGMTHIELLANHQARVAFVIDGLQLYCTVDLGTSRCTLQIEVTCEKCGQTQRRVFASLAALGRILDATRCVQCAAAAE
jgi:hypothetical protein